MIIKREGWQNQSVSPQNLHRSKQRKSQLKNLNGGSQKQRTAVILYKIKIIKCRKPLWHMAFFVTNVVKHVVVPDFEPILSKKIADVFETAQTPKSPKKPVK